jgi:hypothetical protein
MKHRKLNKQRLKKERKKENKKRNSKLDGVRDVDEREWLLFAIHKEAEGSGSCRHIHLHHHNSSFLSPGGISFLPSVIHPNTSITETEREMNENG